MYPVAVSHLGVVGGYALVVRRMFGLSSVMISAPETSRLRIDSEITASGMDLYHSSGVNCAVSYTHLTLPTSDLV